MKDFYEFAGSHPFLTFLLAYPFVRTGRVPAQTC